MEPKSAPRLALRTLEAAAFLARIDGDGGCDAGRRADVSGAGDGLVDDSGLPPRDGLPLV